MIKSVIAYRRAKRRLLKLQAFKAHLKRLLANMSMEDYVKPLELAEQEIEVLEKQIANFEQLSVPTTIDWTTAALNEIPSRLINTRLQLRWTQTELGKETNLTPQQICKYEKANYSNTTLSRIMKISAALEQGLQAKSQAVRALSEERNAQSYSSGS